MLGFDKLASNTRRFRMLMDMSLQEFDLLFVKVEKMYPEAERKRLSKRSRQREIGAGRRFALGVRDRTLLLLFYYRTYATQRCDSQLADSPQLGGRMAPTGSNIATIVLDYARIR